MNDLILQNKTISNNLFEQENIDVAAWMRFLKEQKLDKLFSHLKDPRQQTKVTYPIKSLAMWAFSLCAFRQGSKNALQTTLQGLKDTQKEGFLRLLGIEGHSLPHSSTVDNALSTIPYEEFNEILLSQFDSLLRKKFFYNHHELLPDGVFRIALDGCCVHKYDHPHSVDEAGHNNCPYCLPRTCNKGTPHEKTYYLHIFVICVLICPSMTYPLYIYPLKAKQVNLNQSDTNLKQECELKAASSVLPLLRQRHPKLPFLFLGDALYANKPFIRLCKEQDFDYIIVLKENLKNVNRKCNELSKHKLYRNFYTNKEIETKGEVRIEKTASWFNKTALEAGMYTNVLRFEEKFTDKEGAEKRGYCGSWLCSMKLSKNNCFKCAEKGRSRWKQEDFHNTCKNRGFDIEHDIARKDPNLSIVWKMMTFVSFAFFEIFQRTTIAIGCRKRRSLMKFARDMLGQLITIGWEWLTCCPILRKERVQFRYHFGGGP